MSRLRNLDLTKRDVVELVKAADAMAKDLEYMACAFGRGPLYHPALYRYRAIRRQHDASSVA